MTTWIATRSLVTEEGVAAEVSIGAPEPMPDGQWQCAVRVVVGGHVDEQTVRGLDAFQALQLAVGTIGQEIGPKAWTWLAALPRFPGFYRVLVYDDAMNDRGALDAAVDAVLEEQQAAWLTVHRPRRDPADRSDPARVRADAISDGMNHLHAVMRGAPVEPAVLREAAAALRDPRFPDHTDAEAVAAQLDALVEGRDGAPPAAVLRALLTRGAPEPLDAAVVDALMGL